MFVVIYLQEYPLFYFYSMPHISSKKLEQKIYDRIFASMVEAIAKTKNTQESKALVTMLLTPTERTMLAKRYALILMLKRGVRPMYIHQTLKISLTTVAKFGAYMDIVIPVSQRKYTKVTKKEASLWNDIEKWLRLGMPPRFGPGRWRGLYRQFPGTPSR